MKKNNTAAAEKFAKIMIAKMEEMKGQMWERKWFTPNGRKNFYPQNFSGRRYESGNALFLLFCCEENNYQTPLFLTFKQCQNEKISVKKGEGAFPIYFRTYTAYHNENNTKITFEEFMELDEKEKENYRLKAFVNCYNVFNLDQTNFSEKYPEKWATILANYREEEKTLKIENYFQCEVIDEMLHRNSWVCEIELIMQKRAYYNRRLDKISMPPKIVFPKRADFYSVLLHEMAHSTGEENRLGRKFGAIFGDVDYAREEVVAELTAAFTGLQLGVAVEPQKESAVYLNSWTERLRKNPEYIFSVVDDVVKASNYILKNLEVEQMERVAV